ncbi:MAG TPA: 3-hydroxybutyrate oligomer hydrolase family protein [Arenimonas sp.]|uniref:3-hydroxybutyrate oligomer hydrolase family protein n=1 Tax=Arenimonas sp. TaxID=1872635 RepID=UPI002D809C13|nr:3-hydroxybutyrate oligomer hydrolase family protein [Arenimonas sp.]HEU0153667.1 3-hydroxybutyrate oligomer hydrolase family protein [Arenimonas sp.]
MDKKSPPPRPLPVRTAPARDRRYRTPVLALSLLALSLAGCRGPEVRTPSVELEAGLSLATHRGDDDLLTAGLGEAGLRSPTPPAFANPDQPTAAELRRRAVWANWRGIADLSPGGGYGSVYGSLAPVPGREYHALVRLPGRRQPHRVMVQVPDGFDPQARCVVVTASSGSRGIYGAIALAGAWGLPRGCAVAYTDKGAGTGYVDTTDGRGFALDGQLATGDETEEFRVPKAASTDVAAAPIAVKHAHSGDNPEADWGRHVAQAAEVSLQVLALAHPEAGPWTFDNTRVIAVGVSNGGGAVLRAGELPGGRFDAVVAVSPNILPGDGGRALYDYASDAAIWMPCALNASAFDGVLLARPGGAAAPAGVARCASLHAAGILADDAPAAQAEAARRHLLAGGWTDEAIAAGVISSNFDLWRAVDVTYASAYARTGPDDMPCGFSFGAVDADGQPRAPTAAERAAWWSDGSGIPPGQGIALRDPQAAGTDPTLAGNLCLRKHWDDADGPVRAGIEATRAQVPAPGLPVIVVHGADDGLVPEAFSGGAYARWTRAQGRPVSYWRVRNAQHFDAFLGLPVLGMRYLPMLPYGYRALDAAWAHVADGTPLPGDADIATTPRTFTDGALAPLQPGNLGTLP